MDRSHCKLFVPHMQFSQIAIYLDNAIYPEILAIIKLVIYPKSGFNLILTRMLG